MALFSVKDRLRSEQIFNGAIFDVRVDTIVMDDGREFSREVVMHPGGVCIACKPAPDEVFLIRQYRYSVDEELIELPAGRVDPGEDRLAAAERELIEETGYRADKWTNLPAVFSAPGFCDEVLTCYLAEDITWVGTNPDEDEDIEVMRVTLKEAWQMVVDGRIRDCKTIAILGLLMHK